MLCRANKLILTAINLKRSQKWESGNLLEFHYICIYIDIYIMVNWADDM